MTLQNKNLFDPIEYMIRRMNRTKPGYGNPGEGSEFDGPLDLIRENGVLTKVVGEDWQIELFYNSRRVLDKVIGTSNNGYRLEVTLIYDTAGLLVRVEPVEFMGDDTAENTNNWDNPVVLE